MNKKDNIWDGNNKKFNFEGNYFRIPHDLLIKFLKNISYSARYLMIAMFSLSNRYGSTFYMSDASLSKKYDIPIKTIRKTRKELKNAGLINYSSGHQNNGQNVATTYTLVPNQGLRDLLQITTRVPKKVNVSKKDRTKK